MILFAAALKLVTGPRFPVQDRVCLIAILAIAARLYLRDRGMISIALAFAIGAWWMDAMPPHWLDVPVRGIAALRVPPPTNGPPHDFVEAQEHQIAARRFEAEHRFIGYVVLNFLAFLILLSVRRLQRHGEAVRCSTHSDDATRGSCAG